MSKGPAIGRVRLKTMILVLFILFPATSLAGSDFIKSGKALSRTDPGRRIALSLRISEAKGNRGGRTYFRSLLRQSKRKPIRIELFDRHRTRSPRD